MENTTEISTKKEEKKVTRDTIEAYEPGHTDESSSGAEDDGSSEEDDDSNIEFPRDNAQDLMNFLHRDITNLSNVEDVTKRKFAVMKLYQIFVLAKNKASNKVYQEVLSQIQKPLFKRFMDKVEKIREMVCLIVREMFSRVDDLTFSIPYLLPILVERLSAKNIEGTDGMDEKVKPAPSQKPFIMIDPPESSEEVRSIIAEIVTIMVSTTVWDCLRPYIDDFVNVCRALCMDPAGDVIIEGCQAMAGLADTSGDNLMHFCHDMGRSLFTSFAHRHAKVRMAGLKCLFSVMGCGIWKTSVYVLEGMVGFRDPNIVPIKDFYEPSTKLNYFALFVGDRSTVCRELFYVTMGKMLTMLPDKYDHEGRLFPYIISALYDSHDGIKSTGFDILEEVG